MQLLLLDILLLELVDCLIKRFHRILFSVFVKVFKRDGEHFDVSLRSRWVSHLELIQNRYLVQNAAWLFKGIKIKVSASNCQKELNLAWDKDVNLVQRLALLDEFLVLLEEFFLHDDDELVRHIFWEILQIQDVSHLLLDPLLVLVLIWKQVIFELLTEFWEHVEHFIEFLLANLAHHGVTFWAHTGAPWLLSDQRILTKESSCFHTSHEQIFVVDRVFDVDLTFSVFNDVKSLALLSLVDQRVLWV